jgi:glycosyltransferase involved in cell wall biosynthesis
MITVVIPVRNREHLVARAIESAATQSLPPDEIIVVDDASIDHTKNVVESISKSLKTLKLISLKENAGAAKARNIGIQSAKSNLIAFLDSDDVWYTDKLAKQVKELDANKNVVATFCGVVIVEPGTDYRHHYIPKREVTLNDLYHSSLLVTMSCALIRKTALFDAGGFDETLRNCEDWDLFIRLAERGKISVVQEELVEYWRHRGARLTREKLSVLSSHDVVFERIYKRIADPRMMRKVRASHEMRMADIFSTDCFEPLRALGHSCKSLFLAPSHEGWYNFRSVLKTALKNIIFRRGPSGAVEKNQFL